MLSLEIPPEKSDPAPPTEVRPNVSARKVSRKCSRPQIGPAVDVDDLPGEIALLWLREEERGGGDLVDLSGARNRRQAIPEGRHAGRRRPRRLDGAGGDDVGGDALVAELDSERARQSGQA